MRVTYRRRYRRTHGVFWGLLFVGLGAALLLDRMPELHLGSPWTWWPFFVVALGFARLVTAGRPKDVGDGVMFMLIGGWFWVAQTGWHGFTWGNSWPLALIAVGLGMVTTALAGKVMPPRDEDDEHGTVRVETHHDA